MVRFRNFRSSVQTDDNTVAIVQRSLQEMLGESLAAFPAALDTLIANELWRQRADATNTPFT
jgi:hypothetical protein